MVRVDNPGRVWLWAAAPCSGIRLADGLRMMGERFTG